jgi:RNA polymerase sigma factor for flagellar operon FliA
VDVGPLVEAYLPLVGAIARTVGRSLPSSVEKDDLVHDGVVGLIAALQRYDPGRGVGFSTYAGHRIRGAMLDGLRTRDPLPRAVRRAQKTSADGPVWPGAGGGPLLELDEALSIPADDDAGPEAQAIEADLRRRVWDGLAALPVRDREVLLLRMVHDLPLRFVAQRLGISITRTAELQTRGIERLRRYLDGDPMIPPRRASRARIRRRQEADTACPNPSGGSPSGS